MAVITAAGEEDGGRVSGPASTDGTAIRFLATGSQSRRLGWSLAQWAVARAQGLQIDEVQTDGRRWSRKHPGQGWKRATDAAPSGTVIIHVASGH